MLKQIASNCYCANFFYNVRQDKKKSQLADKESLNKKLKEG